MTGRTTASINIETIAAEAFDVLGTGRQIAPFSDRVPDFDLEDAYRVTAAVRQMREARGETPVGRKIGFTNRTIWEEYRYFVDRMTRPEHAVGGGTRDAHVPADPGPVGDLRRPVR